MPNSEDAHEALAAEVQRLRAENAQLKRRRQFGLVWESQPEERIEKEMRERLPVLKHLKSLDIRGVAPSVERPHLLIEGDNLHALTALQATHKGVVDVIYIDPPYNTGNEFVYNDHLVSKDDSFRHSAWLSFMHKRLTLARELLADTGVILMSIDDNEQAHLRLLCDQVFGEKNFIATVVWQGSRKNNARYVSSGHDYILIYAKSEASLSAVGTRWREQKFGVDEVRAKAREIWQQVNGDKTLARRKMKQWYASFPKGHPITRLARYSFFNNDGTLARDDNITSPTGQGATFPVLHPTTGLPVPVPPRGWRYSSPERMQQAIDADEIIFGADHTHPISQKRHLRDTEGQVALSVFERQRTHAKRQLERMIGAGKFQFPKDVEVLEHWIGLVSQPNSVILDFFAGSGSTAHAVASLNAADGGSRQAILVTNNENGICRSVTQPRLKAALTGKWADGKEHDPLPGSLRFYVTELLPKLGSRDALRMRAAKGLTDMLSVRENAYRVVESNKDYTVLDGEARRIAVWTNLFDDAGLLSLLGRVELDAPDAEWVLYAASAGLFGVDQALVNLTSEHAEWRVEALPEPFIRELEKAQATAKRGPR